MASFGPYELLKRLGAGGMGEVFLARLTRSDAFEKLLVIKRILPHLGADDAFRELFRREARIAAMLSHQNVVQIFDYGEVDSQSFIAMEYVEGIDAASLLRRHGALSLDVVLRIAIDAARGLDYAHRKVGQDGTALGLVHRDVAPKNLLLSCEGEVKWIDFGLAAVVRAGARERIVAGTVPYMSPEQAKGARLDRRADLFALGVTLCELLCGARPFVDVGDDLEAHVDAVLDGEIALPSAHGAPDALDPVVCRLVASDPAERFQSARELLSALDKLARRDPPVPPHELGALVRASRRESESGLPIATAVRTLVGDAPIASSDDAPSDERDGSDEGGGGNARRPGDRETANAAASETSETATQTGELESSAATSEEPVVRSGETAPSQGPWLAIVALVLLATGLGAWWALSQTPDGNAQVGSKSARWEMAIESSPQGANVFIDGESVGQTPLAGLELPPRRQAYALRVSAPGYVDVTDSISLGDEGGKVARTFALEPEPGRLELVISPADASTRVDGTVARGDAVEVAAGTHTVVVSAPGHVSQTTTVVIPPGGKTSLSIALEPESGAIRATSNVAGASVVIRPFEDDPKIDPVDVEPILTCSAPCLADGLSPGRYHVTASASGHSTASRVVRVGPGGRAEVELTCERVEGETTARARAGYLAPRGGATLMLGGKRRSRLSLPVRGASLVVGSTTVRLSVTRDGALSASVAPFAMLELDGRRIKPPFSEKTLGRGRHRLRLPGGGGIDIVVR